MLEIPWNGVKMLLEIPWEGSKKNEVPRQGGGGGGGADINWNSPILINPSMSIFTVHHCIPEDRVRTA